MDALEGYIRELNFKTDDSNEPENVEEAEEKFEDNPVYWNLLKIAYYSFNSINVQKYRKTSKSRAMFDPCHIKVFECAFNYFIDTFLSEGAIYAYYDEFDLEWLNCHKKIKLKFKVEVPHTNKLGNKSSSRNFEAKVNVIRHEFDKKFNFVSFLSQIKYNFLQYVSITLSGDFGDLVKLENKKRIEKEFSWLKMQLKANFWGYPKKAERDFIMMTFKMPQYLKLKKELKESIEGSNFKATHTIDAKHKRATKKIKNLQNKIVFNLAIENSNYLTKNHIELLANHDVDIEKLSLVFNKDQYENFNPDWEYITKNSSIVLKMNRDNLSEYMIKSPLVDSSGFLSICSKVHQKKLEITKGIIYVKKTIDKKFHKLFELASDGNLNADNILEVFAENIDKETQGSNLNDSMKSMIKSSYGEGFKLTEISLDLAIVTHPDGLNSPEGFELLLLLSMLKRSLGENCIKVSKPDLEDTILTQILGDGAKVVEEEVFEVEMNNFENTFTAPLEAAGVNFEDLTSEFIDKSSYKDAKPEDFFIEVPEEQKQEFLQEFNDVDEPEVESSDEEEDNCYRKRWEERKRTSDMLFQNNKQLREIEAEYITMLNLLQCQIEEQMLSENPNPALFMKTIKEYKRKLTDATLRSRIKEWENYEIARLEEENQTLKRKLRTYECGGTLNKASHNNGSIGIITFLLILYLLLCLKTVIGYQDNTEVVKLDNKNIIQFCHHKTRQVYWSTTSPFIFNAISSEEKMGKSERMRWSEVEALRKYVVVDDKSVLSTENHMEIYSRNKDDTQIMPALGNHWEKQILQ